MSCDTFSALPLSAEDPAKTPATPPAGQLPSFSLALTGSGGAGVLTAGQILMDAWAAAGGYALMGRSLGPQIRGGESAALLRLSTRSVESPDDCYDLLVAVDWGNIDRFAGELPLHGSSVIVSDPAAGPVPPVMTTAGAQIAEIPLKALAASVDGGRINMVALGVAAACAGVPAAALPPVLSRLLGDKGEDAVASSLAAIEAGRQAALACPALVALPRLSAPVPATTPRWSLSGNEATGLGALRAGVAFSAAYPITPATEVLEWLAPRLAATGGTLVQAEDELASITMCLGASFGGVPSLTATSGPGLALMLEGLGLAVASETPVTVVDVMRGGPSTGIPTKSEQSDFNIAVYGLHGDAPHVVTAPTSIADCARTAQWSVMLAEALQTVVIMLSDQAGGQSRAVVAPPEALPGQARRKLATAEDLAAAGSPYLRYQPDVEDGVSPMALPGTAGGVYTADGLEHSPKGTPSTQGQHHLEQLDKRLNKIVGHDYGPLWADIEEVPLAGQDSLLQNSAEQQDSDCRLAILVFGSLAMAAREACQRLAARGIAVRLVAPRLLLPAQPLQMARALTGITAAVVVEQNHSGQFATFLQGHYSSLPERLVRLHRPGPLAIRPQEIVEAVLSLLPAPPAVPDGLPF